MSDNSEILKKIRKCMALSASSNEHEAAAALRQARALMEKHGLTDADVLAAEAGEQAAKAGATERPARWEAFLAHRTADIFGCEIVFTTGAAYWNKPGQWRFIGVGGSQEVAGYCFEVLLRQVRRARADHIKANLKRCKAATKTRRADLFCEGWVTAAVGKIEAMALGEREQAAVDAYLAKQFPALRELKATDRSAGKKSLSGSDYTDYAAGRLSGRDAELNRGVGAGAAPLALE